MKIRLVSVVRDYSMYAKCICDNPYCEALVLDPLDNREENLPIPVRYNAFIDSLPPGEDAWLVFCHEDWQPRSFLSEALDGLDKGCIYGTVGVYVQICEHSDFYRFRGHMSQCKKDGSNPSKLHCPEKDRRVGTFDCCCIIVHSSLVRKFSLRFDENLLYDMYAEDFAAWAHEKHGIESYVLEGFESMHFSEGDAGDRFYHSLEYVKEKFRNAKGRYATTVGRLNNFGAGEGKKPIYYVRYNLGTWLRYLIKR